MIFYIQSFIITLFYTVAKENHNAENNKERFIADKENYINENLDRKRWSNMLDAELFEQFLEFYNASIE